MSTGTHHEYDTDYIKLYWQIEALKGQVRELERDRNRHGNLLWVMRLLLLRSLKGLGVQEDLQRLSDGDLLQLFDKITRNDHRFSLCPNAAHYHCRPLSLRFTYEGEPVACDDCGWSLLDAPLQPPPETEEPPPEAE